MKRVVILIDSTADLSPDILQEINVYSLPHYIRFDNSIYQDGFTIVSEEVYDKIEQEKMIPVATAPTVMDFIVFFNRFIKLDYDVLYIGMGNYFSAAITNAKLARDQVLAKRIYIVNSKNISSGIALLALKAAKMRESGMSASSIKVKLDKLVPLVRGYFIIKNYQYFHKFGEASRSKEIIRTVFWMKPILHVFKGKLKIHKKIIGSVYRAVRVLFKEMIFKKMVIDLDFIIVTQSLANREAVYLARSIKENLDPKMIVESRSGSVIAAHCGPGSIGVHYILKDKNEKKI